MVHADHRAHGPVFCDGCGLTNAEGDLFFGAYNTGEIRQVRLTADRKGISTLSVAFDFSGSVESMERAPSGLIYFSSPNAIYQLAQA